MRVIVLCNETTRKATYHATKAEELPREGLQVLASVLLVSARLHHHKSINNNVHEGACKVHKETEHANGHWALEVDHCDHPSC